jgi:hypothetical protein
MDDYLTAAWRDNCCHNKDIAGKAGMHGRLAVFPGWRWRLLRAEFGERDIENCAVMQPVTFGRGSPAAFPPPHILIRNLATGLGRLSDAYLR